DTCIWLLCILFIFFFFFFQAEDGIRDGHVTGVQTCALPIYVFVQNTKTVSDYFAVKPRLKKASADCSRKTSKNWRAKCYKQNARSEERRVGKECRTGWSRE